MNDGHRNRNPASSAAHALRRLRGPAGAGAGGAAGRGRVFVSRLVLVSHDDAAEAARRSNRAGAAATATATATAADAHAVRAFAKEESGGKAPHSTVWSAALSRRFRFLYGRENAVPVVVRSRARSK